MLSQEFQVSEHQKGNAMGDFWGIASSAADIRASFDATKQSEAAEVFYKGILIKPLKVMPAQYTQYCK